MLATVLHGPGDVRFEEVTEPKILKPTDAVIKLTATCICGSDLWPYRGLQPLDGPMHMGHEYCGVVVEVAADVKTVRPGQFVVGSFCLSDNTCPHCRHGFQSSCEQREFMSGAQASYARVPLADGTLVATETMPDDDLIPSLLAVSDVLGRAPFRSHANPDGLAPAEGPHDRAASVGQRHCRPPPRPDAGQSSSRNRPGRLGDITGRVARP